MRKTVGLHPLWATMLNILFVFNLIIRCTTQKCLSSVCNSNEFVDINLNDTVKNSLINSVFNCETPKPFKYITIDDTKLCNLTLNKGRPNIYNFQAKASKLVTVLTNINIYECSVVEIKSTYFLERGVT